MRLPSDQKPKAALSTLGRILIFSSLRAESANTEQEASGEGTKAAASESKEAKPKGEKAKGAKAKEPKTKKGEAMEEAAMATD